MIRRLTSFVAAFLLSISSSLFLLVPKVAAATITWDGGGADNNFSTAENWSGDVVPQSGDVIVFAALSETDSETLVNDLEGVSFAGLTRSSEGSGATVYTIDKLAFASNAVITTQVSPKVSINISDSVAADGALVLDGGAYPFFPSGKDVTLSLEGLTVRNITPPVLCGGLGGNTSSGGYSFSWVNTGSLTIGQNTIYTMSGTESQVNVSAGGVLQLPYDKKTISSDITFNGGAASESINCGEKVSLRSMPGDTTFTGKITLKDGNVRYFIPYGSTLKITGQIVGSGGALLPSAKSAGTFINNAKSDNSKTPKGTQEVAVKTLPTIKDNKPNEFLIVEPKTLVTLDGARGPVTVAEGGELRGTGVALNLFVNGTLSPGHSPGSIKVMESLIINPTGDLKAELHSTESYDKVVVGEDHDITQAAVRLGDNFNEEYPTLNVVLYGEYDIKEGDVFTIIDNKSDTDVEGMFDGLPEGETFELNGGVFKISYEGGDGNDVTLTVVSAPDAPDTGFMLLASNPVATLGAATLAAGSLMVLSRRSSRKYSARRK